MVVPGDDQIIEQVIKQLCKLVDVIKVVDLTGEDRVERELVLIKVNARGADRAEIMRIVDIFRAKIVDVNPLSFTIEITGTEDKIEGILALLKVFGIKKLIRTGRIALSRGGKKYREGTGEWRELSY
jgi:acetolactate synthase-1/3 small subunit